MSRAPAAAAFSSKSGGSKKITKKSGSGTSQSPGTATPGRTLTRSSYTWKNLDKVQVEAQSVVEVPLF